MRVSRTGAWTGYVIAAYAIAAWMLFAWSAGVAEAATIAGVVRDAQGNLLDGAHIKLISKQAPERNAQSSSGKDGAYRLAQLLPGTYELSAERSGLVTAAPTVVTLSSASASVRADLTLSRPPQSGGATASQPPLKFEAAGLRGLIDPGGYSAPANAASASGLISGVADIRRTENGAALPGAKDLPCALEPELTKAVAATPQNADANRRLGEFYLAHRQPGRAIQYLERSRQIDSANSKTLLDSRTALELSEALLMSGQFDAAREVLIALPAGQRDVETRRLLARAEEGSGQFAQASKEYQIAAEQDPSEENIFGEGYELILAGLPADAARVFRAGAASHPLSVTLLIGEGTAEFLQGHSSDAVKLFLQATDLKPSDPRPYSFLVGAFGISGAQGEQVRASLKRHMELAPADAEAYYLYAVALTHGSANGSANGSASAGAAESGRVESLLKQALALDPNLSKAHFQLGTFYAHRDDYESAAREFEATVRLDPEMKEAHYRLASAYQKTGRAELAEQEMKLFRDAAGSSKTQDEEGGISIVQFISVVDRPGHTSLTETCSSELH